MTDIDNMSESELRQEVQRLRSALTNRQATMGERIASAERVAHTVIAERDALAARLALLEHKPPAMPSSTTPAAGGQHLAALLDDLAGHQIDPAVGRLTDALTAADGVLVGELVDAVLGVMEALHHPHICGDVRAAMWCHVPDRATGKCIKVGWCAHCGVLGPCPTMRVAAAIRALTIEQPEASLCPSS